MDNKHNRWTFPLFYTALSRMPFKFKWIWNSFIVTTFRIAWNSSKIKSFRTKFRQKQYIIYILVSLFSEIESDALFNFTYYFNAFSMKKCSCRLTNWMMWMIQLLHVLFVFTYLRFKWTVNNHKNKYVCRCVHTKK